MNRGTTWTQPCSAAYEGLHYYRRPVVSVDFLDDARNVIGRLADWIETNTDARVDREKGIVYDA